MNEINDQYDNPWDRRYASMEQVWSGQPNATLVREAGGLAPGRALDVGCGEGADALWLAERGWDVTALDVSRVALDRAADHAERAGVRVRWRHAGLVEAALPPASFDLVSAQYPVLLRTEDHSAEFGPDQRRRARRSAPRGAPPPAQPRAGRRGAGRRPWLQPRGLRQPG